MGKFLWGIEKAVKTINHFFFFPWKISLKWFTNVCPKAHVSKNQKLKPKAHKQILKCAVKSTTISPSSTLYRHPQNPPYRTAIVEPTINLWCSTTRNRPSRRRPITSLIFSSEVKAKGGHNWNGICACWAFTIFRSNLQ